MTARRDNPASSQPFLYPVVRFGRGYAVAARVRTVRAGIADIFGDLQFYHIMRMMADAAHAAEDATQEQKTVQADWV